jgi:hypothetical protein
MQRIKTFARSSVFHTAEVITKAQVEAAICGMGIAVFFIFR